MQGSVKFYNRKKGFGFISGEDGQDYFVHFTGLTEGTFLRDNDLVEFEAAEGERGPKAQNVNLLTKASDRDDIPQEEGSEEATSEEAPAQEEAASEEAPAKEEEATEEAPAQEEATSEEEPAKEE
jgi:CspA family cold shock protein